ncbi:hypothetical protein [uncultured Methanoregula sp.]|uniref:hypothetical protein n=1 Tax=uncultured Methanoregula sp. TaxID=1005933 RepID=UPI002AABFBF4|nr:hypothetical protein [uncultured Methanoregula sp.]
MRARAIALLFLILAACIVAPVLAANEDRYGYIKVEDVMVQLDNGTAVIHVNYTVDESTRFIFFLFGKQDLKNKLLKILNYDDARMRSINLSRAEFVVDDAALSYGDGIYWYPSHDFNVAIPTLTVKTPQTTKNFTMAKQFPAGLGYFAEADHSISGAGKKSTPVQR